MKFIAIEGLDRVGKTTTAAAVAERMGGVLLSSIALPQDLLADVARANAGDDADARFEEYARMNAIQITMARAAAGRLISEVEGHDVIRPQVLRPDATDDEQRIAREAWILQVQAQVEIARSSNQHQLVVADSSIYRTVASHRALGSAQAQAYRIMGSIRPDATVLLELDEEQRLSRLAACGDLPHPTLWGRRLHERSAAAVEAYHSFGLPSLDASLPTHELAAQIEQLVLDAHEV